jgi:hypothetical protein
LYQVVEFSCPGFYCRDYDVLLLRHGHYFTLPLLAEA